MKSIAFNLGGLTIYWYGILVALGFLAGIWTASRRGLRDGIAAETVVDIGPWIIVGALIGARLLYVISYWREQFASKPIWEILAVRHGGLVFYGGLIGASIAVLFFARVRNLPLWRLADLLAPSISLGQAFGRLGCLMNGCCYGRATNLPWAIHYPATHETFGSGVHPTQVYESILDLGLYALLAQLFRRRHFEGQVFATYLVGYALLRAFVECFRGDYLVYYLGGWATPAQLVSAGILAAGLYLFWKLRRPLAPLGADGPAK